MRHQAEGNSTSPETHRMDRKVLAAGVNACWKGVKESKLEASVLAVDWANQPGGGTKDPLAGGPAPDAFVPGYKLDAFAQGCKCWPDMTLVCEWAQA